jgi:type IV secretion system protein VirD4
MPSGWEGIHGESRWTIGGLNLINAYDRDLGGVVAIPLGLNEISSDIGHAWQPSIEQGHGLCFAPNRTGKGASVIIPTLLTYAGNASIFCIDPKGENTWVTAPRRRELGQRVVILDPLGEVNRRYGKGQQVEKITSFNPLSQLDETSPRFAVDVAALSEALIIGDAGSHNKHFTDTARDYVGGITALVKEAFGAAANLNHVRRLIVGDPEDLLALYEEVRLGSDDRPANPDSLGVRKLRRFLTHGTDEIKNAQSTAETQLSFLDSADMQAALVDDPDNQFTYEEWAKGGMTVYVVLPPGELVTYARWMRLMVAFALRASTRIMQTPATPNLMICDEMGTIGALRSLEDAFGLLAGYGIRFFGFFQSLSQMKRDYPESWSNLINNCSYLQLLAGRDPETCKYFSELLGYKTVESMDRTKQVRQPLMDPEQIARLLGAYPDQLEKNLQVVVSLQGNQKFKLYQNPYFMQRSFDGWYRPLPEFAAKSPAYDRNYKPQSRTAPVSHATPAPQAAQVVQQRRGGLFNFNTPTSKVFAAIAAFCLLAFLSRTVPYMRGGIQLYWFTTYEFWCFVLAFGIARMTTKKQ